ncbi:transposon TX1 putative 149 kDa protein, partial [Trifolium medium]|nr:transposon TX1 putative 149 kDa protein [Trifolium medium]
MHPNVSDHALLCLKSAGVANSWHGQLSGRPMYVLWKKLQRLQPILKEISKPLSDVKLHISKVRENMLQAQLDLGLDRMNADKIEVVKQCSDDLLNWQKIEEKILQQKSKLEWLKLGDGNNRYFHASIKTRSTSKSINVLLKEDGTQITAQEDIEEEVMSFYNKLIGTSDTDLNGIDITVMREGPQLSNEQRQKLIAPITDKEIECAMQSIGDLKSPSIDGYGAYFFKKAWKIVKSDVLAAVHDFFDNGRLYKAANCTLVTLLPKSKEAKRIKEYRPISCCSTICKIISKILTKRMGEVMTSIVGQNQAAFVPGSVAIMMEAFEKFSKSTGVKVNPTKCCIFFGGVDQSIKDDIKRITHFEE